MNLREFHIACRSDATVLISGPTGSGKTRLARKIHEQSERKLRPFVTVNLASLHEGTLESELFGHERGAFTGADQRRVGRIEGAQGGTLFLDEIGDLSPRLQARLLEFLQSKTLTAVGGNRTIQMNVRVIAATHRNLEQEAKVGRFREDLFHRLRVITISLPGLSDSPEDFNEVLHDCLNDVCANLGRSILRISEEAAGRFEAYHWPGNYRELRNVLEYAIHSSQNGEISIGDLPRWFGDAPASEAEPRSGSTVLKVAEVGLTLDFQETFARFEKDYLAWALGRYRGRINKTAREIGMNKTTLIRRIRAYGIQVAGVREVQEALVDAP